MLCQAKYLYQGLRSEGVLKVKLCTGHAVMSLERPEKLAVQAAWPVTSTTLQNGTARCFSSTPPISSQVLDLEER